MCGIVYVKNEMKPATSAVLKRYNAQRHRGFEGFGYVAMQDGNVAEWKRTQTEKEMTDALHRIAAHEVLMHHRYPTSTPNVPESNHPIRIEAPKLKSTYYVAHNGHIWNADKLRKAHKKLGIAYTTDVRTTYETSGAKYEAQTTFNDSESLAVDVALYLEKYQDEIRSEGDIAFIALETRDGKALRLHYGKNNGNPLGIIKHDGFMAITSEGGTPLEPDVLYTFDYETGETTTRRVPIGKATRDAHGIGFTSSSYRDRTYLDDDRDAVKWTPIPDQQDYLEATQERARIRQQMQAATAYGDYERLAELEDELEMAEETIRAYDYAA